MSDPEGVLAVLERMSDPDGARGAARAMGAGRSVGFDVEGDAVTVTTVNDGVVISAGVDDTDLVIGMDRAAFADLVAEEQSVFGLLYGGRLTVERGDFDRFALWEPALQSLLYGRPVFDASCELPADFDVTRAWSLDVDEDDEMRVAFDRAGFLHVKQVFSASEIGEMSEETDRLRAESRPDDRTSWWAALADGTEVCCRVTYMAERSATFARVASDPRLARLAALSGLDLRAAHDRNDGVSVVIKNPGAVSGLSDLPWHRDCGLGGHPLKCPGVLVGINLDRADAEHGRLWFLPGSHLHGGPVGDPESAGHRVVAIDTEPGDVTVHYQHILHAAPPPTASAGAGRRAVYVGFERTDLFEVVRSGRGYNDVMYSADGSVRNVREASQ